LAVESAAEPGQGRSVKAGEGSLVKIFCAIAVVADLALAAFLVALSGFIFGGGPEGMHGETGAAMIWWGAFISALVAPVLGILLFRHGRPGPGVLIAWAPVIVALVFASIS
jgi:hypothetical protein